MRAGSRPEVPAWQLVTVCAEDSIRRRFVVPPAQWPLSPKRWMRRGEAAAGGFVWFNEAPADVWAHENASVSTLNGNG